MKLVPQIIVRRLYTLANTYLAALQLIVNIAAWKYARQTLYLVLNGRALETKLLVAAIFPGLQISLNYDSSVYIDDELANRHSVSPTYAVVFQNPQKATHMLPFFSYIEYFYVESGIFYISGRELPDLTWNYEIIEKFSDFVPMEHSDIFVDFEAYNQVKRGRELDIYPSELGAVAVRTGAIVDSFHSLIRFDGGAKRNEALLITGIEELTDAPMLTEVLDEFWYFCQKHFPFKLYAKGKFMEYHILRFFVYEFDEPYNYDWLHSRNRKYCFDCWFHYQKRQMMRWKYHCALDDATVLAKLRLKDVDVCGEIQVD